MKVGDIKSLDIRSKGTSPKIYGEDCHFEYYSTYLKLYDDERGLHWQAKGLAPSPLGHGYIDQDDLNFVFTEEQKNSSIKMGT